jgi:hypothetical protein
MKGTGRAFRPFWKVYLSVAGRIVSHQQKMHLLSCYSIKRIRMLLCFTSRFLGERSLFYHERTQHLPDVRCLSKLTSRVASQSHELVSSPSTTLSVFVRSALAAPEERSDSLDHNHPSCRGRRRTTCVSPHPSTHRDYSIFFPNGVSRRATASHQLAERISTRSEILVESWGVGSCSVM